MAKASKPTKQKRLTVKKTTVGGPASPARKRETRIRERPWNEPKTVPLKKKKAPKKKS